MSEKIHRDSRVINKYIYIYFTAQFESNCASDLVSFDYFTAKTRWGGLGGCIGSGDLVPRVSRKESLEMRELKRSLLLRVDFFQMTTRDRRERGKFWPGFRGHLDAYIRHRRSRKSSFRCRATSSSLGIHSTRLFFRASESVDIVSFLLYARAAWTPGR